MLRRIPIRAKVAGALALPLVGLVAAVVIGVSATNSVSESISRQTGLASASVGHAGLIGALQDERNQSLLEMLGLGERSLLEVSDTPTARTRTSAASTALHHSISGQRDRLREDYATALKSLVALPDLRAQAGAAIAEPGLGHRETPAVFTGYTEIISTLFASHDRFSLEVVDPEIRQGDDLVHYGSHATDAVAQLVERLVYVGTGPGGVDQPIEAAEIASLRARRRPQHRRAGAGHRGLRRRGRGAGGQPAGQRPARPRRPGHRRIPHRRPGCPPGRDAARPRRRLPQVPRQRRGRARRAGRGAASRRRRPPPALPRRRAGARRGRGGHRLARQRSITVPARPPQRRDPAPWPPTGCRSPCRTSSTPRPARTW